MDDRLWPKLKLANVDTLLLNAAIVLQQRPFLQGTIKHRASGGVDMMGALAIAAGARFDSLSDNLCQMVIPSRREVSFYAAVDLIESSIDTDLSTWNDEPGRTKEEAIALFERLANEIGNTI